MVGESGIYFFFDFFSGVFVDLYVVVLVDVIDNGFV